MSHTRKVRVDLVDFTGLTFGHWAVEAYSHGAGRVSYWRCRCRCGTVKPVSATSLRNGKSQSCGCLRQYRAGGASHQQLPEYPCWTGIIQRCTNPNSEGYARYGGRGISVAERWSGDNGFQNFLADMGPRPSAKHSIERRDNDSGYEPANCKWATQYEQQRNKSTNRLLTFRGETLCLSDWAARMNGTASVLAGRLARGWTIEKTLTTPVAKNMTRETADEIRSRINGRNGAQLAREYGVSRATISQIKHRRIWT